MKSLDLPKLKASGDKKIHGAKIIISAFDSVENCMRKGGKPDQQPVLLLLRVFKVVYSKLCGR